MSSIDTRVVEMKFDNAQFEAGIKSSLSSLDALNKGLKLDGAAKGLNDVSAASKRFSLANIAKGVDSIAQKFSAMSVIGITALSTLTNKAVNAGLNIAKSLTIAPVMDGMREYETNLNAIQTILANTQAAGTTLKDVNGALSELNTYSDKTIYNFSEMARNIGTFTAAGVDLKTATGSIKGIANLAALSGSNSQQASTAMYQLSQAISAGRVSLQDWNSVVNAGMGGTVFQRALAQTAENMGTLDKGAVKLTGKMKNATINGKSFRESITAKPGEQSWLTSEVLTKTLQQFTGDLSDAQLKAQGFSDAQIKAIQAQAKTAQNAATQVKTMTQLFDTLKESAGSGWAQTWQLIFGDFEEAKSLFTNVSNTLGGFITASSNARNRILGDWKALGGRTVLIKAISTAFQAVMAVIKPIKDAFRDIFPATTGKQLYDMTVNLLKFTQNLKIGGETASNLRHIFQGVFAIFDIGWMVIKKVAGVILDLFGVATSGSGGFLSMLAKVGDWFTNLRYAIKYGDGLTKFFSGLTKILEVPIKLLKAFGSILVSVFSGLGKAGGASVDGLKNRFAFLGPLGSAIASIWGRLEGMFKSVGAAFAPIAGKISDFFSGLMDSIQQVMGGQLDFSHILDAINTGLFAAITLSLRKFLSGGMSVDVGGGFLSKIGDAFEGLTGTLKAMQTQLKANALLKIAAAIGILAVAVVALSLIDPKRLTSALAAISVMFVQLGVALKTFEAAASGPGFAKMPVIAAGLILLAIAVDLMAVAVKKLADLSWGDLAKGLIGLTVMLALLAGTVRAMPNAKGMISTGAGLVLLAVGIRLLVGAVTDLSGLSWEEMSKGLVGVGALLASLALFTRLASADKGGIAQGAGLILLAVGVKILASALKDFSAFSWDEIGRGLVAMAGGLAIMAAALNLIPPSSVLSAAAVLIVAASLGMLASALQQMGSMSWEAIAKSMVLLASSLGIIAVAMDLMLTALPGAAALVVVSAALLLLVPVMNAFGAMPWENIAKGLVMLAGSLLIIATAMDAMLLALPGAAALVVVAAGLAVLAPILMAFGTMSWEAIGKGLVMLAGALTVIGLAGLVLTPVIPTLLGLGVALALLGVGVLAAGVGLAAAAVGLTALAAAGGAAIGVILGIVSGLIGLLPTLAVAVGQAIIAFAQVIATAGPSIVAAMTAVLNALITSVSNVVPKLLALGVRLIMALLTAINIVSPQIISTLVRLLTNLLNAIKTMTPRIVSTFISIMNALLNAVTTITPKIISTAMTLLSRLLAAIVAAVPKMVVAGMQLITGVLNGIANNIGKMVTAATNVIVNFLNGISQNMPRITAAGVNLVHSFIASVTSAIAGEAGSVISSALSVGSNIISGVVRGISNGIGSVTSAAAGMARSALNAAKNALGIHSPSREFAALGKFSGEGYVKGLDGTRAQIIDAGKSLYELIHALQLKSADDMKKYEDRVKASRASVAKDTAAIRASRKKLDDYAKANKDHNKHNNVSQKTIDAEKKRLATAIDNQKKHNKALSDNNRLLAQARSENKKANAAYAANKKIHPQYVKLEALGATADVVAKKLDDANKKLADAKKIRDDYSKSVKDQYSSLPDVSKETKLSDYIADLQKKIVDNQQFTSAMAKLRDLGLNDTMYKDLISKGPDAMPFVNELISGGKIKVDEINTLDATLSRDAGKLGTSAAAELYQAGVDSAAGLVKGLQNQQKNIEKQMDVIAASMIKSIKKALGIHSPSREFAKVGDWSIEGLAKGLKDSGVAETAAENVGLNAINAMRKTLTGLASVVPDSMEMNPTITPVLDLSAVKKGAGQIGSMLPNNALALKSSYSSAANASAGYKSNQKEFATAIAPRQVGPSVVLNQYNNSPKALSEADIYRSTKNQLSVAKGALTKNA